MPLQTAYNQTSTVAKAGMLEGSAAADVISKVVTASATAIEFGRIVAQDASADKRKVQLFAAANTVAQIVGISYADTARQPAPGQTDARYTEKEPISVVHANARVWIPCVDAIPAASYGAPVNVVATVGADQGKASFAAAGGVMPNAKFVSCGTSAGDLVLVELG